MFICFGAMYIIYCTFNCNTQFTNVECFRISVKTFKFSQILLKYYKLIITNYKVFIIDIKRDYVFKVIKIYVIIELYQSRLL